MVSFFVLIVIIVVILFILNHQSKKTNFNSNLYKRLIFITVILGVIFLLATSGRFILPQILQLLKIGLPFLTKFIGI
jgi:hypothetical protein